MMPSSSPTTGLRKRQGAMGLPKEQRPRDGPASRFEADPFVADIPSCTDGDYFGLVLVTNWPPSSDMDDCFREYQRAVKSCFLPEDTAKSSLTASPAAVYFQPKEHLHITLATFVRIDQIRNDSGCISKNRWTNVEERRAVVKRAVSLMEKASKLPDWPKTPIRLKVNSSQIGTRAGILLWDDLSGGIASIRKCLLEASNQTEETDHPIIPGIIHSTVLRFASTPKTPGTQVQKAFQVEVLDKINTEIFPSGKNLFVTSRVQLAVESSPYMHIRDDDQHVVWSCQLQNK